MTTLVPMQDSDMLLIFMSFVATDSVEIKETYFTPVSHALNVTSFSYFYASDRALALSQVTNLYAQLLLDRNKLFLLPISVSYFNGN